MAAAKTQPDCQDTKGKWLQRCWKDGKYTWTTSGVLWNNVKERCTSGSSTQAKEPTYVGATNLFPDYQYFVEWNREQTGYNCGYDLDADLFKVEKKVYSPSTCVLLPSSLNRFLQTNNSKIRKFDELPTGVSYWGKSRKIIKVRVGWYGQEIYFESGPIPISEIELAKSLYLEKKNQQLQGWIVTLSEGMPIDTRVIDKLKEVEFYYEESNYSRWRLRSL